MKPALLALVASALVFAAAGCGGGSKSAVSTTVTTVATTTSPGFAGSVKTHGRYHYPAALINSYMQSCMRTDLTKRAYCACTLDKLSNNVSVRDFVQVGLAGGKMTPRLSGYVNKAATACAKKL